MRSLSGPVIQSAQRFAARWGFLTQELFFEFLCPMSQAQQYRYWSYLVDAGYFVRSKANDRVLLLTRKSRLEIGEEVRPSRSPFYVDHDAVVARFYMTLESRGLLAGSWLEDELMRNSLDAYSILGCEQLHRVPDLIFDLKCADGKSIRCALEIEKVTKSRSRYAKIALAYLGMSKINVIIFGCAQIATERAIRAAFGGRTFLENKRIPGFFHYEEFDPKMLQSKIRFRDNEFSFQEFVEIATKKKVPELDSLRERNEKPFSLKNNEIEKAG